MTATYGEVGLSYAAINWTYDGSELNLGPYAPIVFLDAIGQLLAYQTSGTLAAYSASSGAVSYDARGTLLTYAAVGTLEGE